MYLRLKAVFEKLNRQGQELKPSKCEFFRQELTYLGHVVSKDGIQTHPKKVEAIRKWPISTKCDRSQKLSWAHKLLSMIHQEICTGNKTFVQIDI